MPQGPGLDPILFVPYINYLPDSLQSQVCLFADDTAVYLTVHGQKNASKLSDDLDILQEWERTFDIEFNPSQCQVRHITMSRLSFNSTYFMHGQALESVDNARYLGIGIASNLNFSQHVYCATSNVLTV